MNRNKKHVAMIGGSMGIFSTIRAQSHMRTIMSMLGANVLNQAVTAPQVQNMFDGEGNMTVLIINQLINNDTRVYIDLFHLLIRSILLLLSHILNIYLPFRLFDQTTGREMQETVGRYGGCYRRGY